MKVINSILVSITFSFWGGRGGSRRENKRKQWKVHDGGISLFIGKRNDKDFPPFFLELYLCWVEKGEEERKKEIESRNRCRREKID